MTHSTYFDHAQQWERMLVTDEATRSHCLEKEAREIVARRAGISPGTLENLRNGRLKQIAAHVYGSLRGLVIRELEAEIARLEHELTVARQTSVRPDDDAIFAAAAQLAAARQLIGRK